MISFSLGDHLDQEDSFALIGGADLSQVANGELYSHPVANNSWWSVDLKQIKFGNVSLMAL